MRPSCTLSCHLLTSGSQPAVGNVFGLKLDFSWLSEQLRCASLITERASAPPHSAFPSPPPPPQAHHCQLPPGSFSAHPTAHAKMAVVTPSTGCCHKEPPHKMPQRRLEVSGRWRALCATSSPQVGTCPNTFPSNNHRISSRRGQDLILQTFSA